MSGCGWVIKASGTGHENILRRFRLREAVYTKTHRHTDAHPQQRGSHTTPKETVLIAVAFLWPNFKIKEGREEASGRNFKFPASISYA
jgi:hypothetical protein